MTDNGFWRLLAASGEKKLNIFISEVVVWEKSKARHKVDEASFFYSEDKGIPLNAASFKKTLEMFDVAVVEIRDEIIKKAEEFIDSSEVNFDIRDHNELRDAYILAGAACELDSSTIILSNDGVLIDRAKVLLPGFENLICRNGIKAFVEAEGIKKPGKNPCDFQKLTEEEINSPFSQSMLSVLPIIDPESFEKYKSDLEKINIRETYEKIDSKPVPIPTEFEKLETFLSELQSMDMEIRKRVLGYTHWFSPISKENLYQILESRQYGEENIESNAQRLKQENLLLETENYWLTNNQSPEVTEICEQAMAVVMPEILEILELN